MEMSESETTRHLTPDERKLFHLNMLKLASLLPAMELTVEERSVLNELAEIYFQHKPPPPLPWTDRRKQKEKE
jgi:hypothetical protein